MLLTTFKHGKICTCINICTHLYYVPYIKKIFVFISLYQRVHIVCTLHQTLERTLIYFSVVLLPVSVDGIIFIEDVYGVLEV